MRHASNRHSSQPGKQAGGKFNKTTADFIGISPAVQELRREISDIASDPRGSNVLITGERGTGKDLVALILHCLSVYVKDKTVMVHQDGGTFHYDHIQSQLFGHAKGAYTGASESRKGCFRAAKHGTLFINEIGNIAMNIQPELLRVLEYKVIIPMGADNEVDVDALMIFATNCDPDALCAAGLFRKDLLDRMRCHHLHIAPLRDRREDIAPLIDFLFEKKCRALYISPVPKIDPQVHKLLSCHELEGNVRQLDTIIDRAFTRMLREKKTMLTACHLQAEKGMPGAGAASAMVGVQCPKAVFLQQLDLIVSQEQERWKGCNSRQADCLFDVEQFVRDVMELMLRKTGNNKTLSAKRLNISRHRYYQ